MTGAIAPRAIAGGETLPRDKLRTRPLRSGQAASPALISCRGAPCQRSSRTLSQATRPPEAGAIIRQSLIARPLRAPSASALNLAQTMLGGPVAKGAADPIAACNHPLAANNVSKMADLLDGARSHRRQFPDRPLSAWPIALRLLGGRCRTGYGLGPLPH